MIIIDKFSITKFFWLRLFLDQQILIIQSSASFVVKIFITLLRLFGWNIRFLNFQLGELEKTLGQNILANGLELNDSLSKEIANEYVAKYKILSALNAYNKNNIANAIIAKYVFSTHYDFCWNIKIIEALHPGVKTYLGRKLKCQNVRVLKQFETEGFVFYYDLNSVLKQIFLSFAVICKFQLLKFKAIFRSLIKHPIISKNNSGSVNIEVIFSFLEHEEPVSDRLRTTFFWLPQRSSNYKIVTFKHENSDISPENHQFIDDSFYGQSMRVHRSHYVLKEIKDFKKRLWLKVINPFGFFTLHLWVHCLTVLNLSEKMAYLFIEAKVNKFVFKETHGIRADAVNFFHRKIGIESFWIQYAACTIPNVNMQPFADKNLIFSSKYKKLMSNEYSQDHQFITVGYPYRQMEGALIDQAQQIRQDLEAKGIKFIIGYFDESVQSGQYALITQEDHWSDMETLASFILENPDVAILLKPQFTFNTIAKRVKHRDLVARAFASGRLLEIVSGTKTRNLIMPAEIALASDVCIGNLVGGTALVETALFGCRSILTNQYNVSSHLLSGELPENIIFQNVADALAAISDARKEIFSDSEIGVWGPYLAQEDQYTDGRSFDRIAKAILKQ